MNHSQKKSPITSSNLLIEHCIDEHGEVEESHAGGEPLDPREPRARRPKEDAKPQVVVRQVLLYRLAEDVRVLPELLLARHGHQPINLW